MPTMASTSGYVRSRSFRSLLELLQSTPFRVTNRVTPGGLGHDSARGRRRRGMRDAHALGERGPAEALEFVMLKRDA
jgi:hypothetical protein